MVHDCAYIEYKLIKKYLIEARYFCSCLGAFNKLKILFYGGIGWGFSQDMYDYVFEPTDAKQHKPKIGIDLRYLLNVVFNDHDLIWCKDKVSRRACFLPFLFKSRAARSLNQLYRSSKAKILPRFHYLGDFTRKWQKRTLWKRLMESFRR